MKPAINVTPLIDVLLVLVIIFMVITPLKPSAFKTKIPAVPRENKDASVNPDTLVVSLTTSDEIFINNEKAANLAEKHLLTQTLVRIFEKRTASGVFSPELSVRNDLPAKEKIENTVFIKAPRGTGYGSVADVIDAVKLSGASPIALQIEDLN